MKQWIAPIFVSSVLAAGAHSALAQRAAGPGGPPVPADQVVDAAFCPTSAGLIRLEVTGKVHPMNLPGGRQIIAFPNVRVTVTALANGNSASYVITGATHVESLTNNNLKVTSTGRNLLIIPQANGHPAGLALTTGTVTFVIDTLGNEVEPFSGTGRVLDVCQALA